jgi:LmbE family N-acetylglucosaminyl deacetylase
MKVLVIAAHPDDEILGVGGAVAAHVAQGDTVQLAIMCGGGSVRYLPEGSPVARKEAEQAAEILAVAELVVRDLPDQGLDTLPISQVAGEIESLLRSFRPDTVYSHFCGDINRDHRVLAEAVMVAARPYAAPFVREILMYETPSSTEWGIPQLSSPFVPNVFVDITKFLETKLRAFSCYSAEICLEPHPRSLAALRARAQYWGSLVNRQAAEVFISVRSLR